MPSRNLVSHTSSQYLVKKMCDLTEPLVSDRTKVIFEPGCGDGNFLAEIVARRLQLIHSARCQEQTAKERASNKWPTKEQSPRAPISKNQFLEEQALEAISNIYALDTDFSATQKAKARLFELIQNSFPEPDYRFFPLISLFLEQNIKYGDFLSNPKALRFVQWHRIAAYNYRSKPFLISDLLTSGDAQ